MKKSSTFFSVFFESYAETRDQIERSASARRRLLAERKIKLVEKQLDSQALDKFGVARAFGSAMALRNWINEDDYRRFGDLLEG